MKILKFGADYCVPCKMLSKNLASLDLPVIHYDVDSSEAEPFVEKYGIRNVPVLIFVDDSDKEIKRLVGAVSKQVVIDTYNELVKN